MTVSSIGSDIFFGVALVAISALVLLLLRQYLPLRSNPAYLLVPVFLALALPLSIIILVPIDLASSTRDVSGDGRGIWLPERAILVFWRIAYWLTFLLTWIVLPLLGEYIDSGYREPKDRIIYSLRMNGRYQLIVLSLAILGGVYLILTNGFHASTPKALVMALAYAWGLIMAVYLMGHGLVAIPRRMFRNARTLNRLRRLQAHAPKVDDKRQESHDQLVAIEGQIAQLRAARSSVRGDLKDWVDEVVESTIGSRTQGLPYSSSSTTPTVVTERYLADLSRKLKRARHKSARFEDEWQRLVTKAGQLQNVIDAAGSKRLVFDDHGGKTRLKLITPSMRYMLYAYGLPAMRISVGVLLGLASVLLIWSEIIRALLPERLGYLSVVGWTVVHHPDSATGQIGIGGQIIAAMWLLYMCFAALYSMSEVKVWGNRALVRRQTYGESACWYSLQVAKLTVPLAFNFITMLSTSIYKETSFYNFLGKLIDLTAIGQGFSDHFPLFILVPVCATLFNLYGKVKNVFGFGVLDDESEENAAGFGTGGWREGQALIERELRDRGGLLPSSQSRVSSNRPSLDTGRDSANQGRAPLLMPLGGPADGRNSPRPTAPRVDRRPPPPMAPEDEDDSPRYFFQDFGERVRNTIDTTDKPRWLSDLGKGFSKPKWMQRDNHDSDGGGGNPWARMFSGGQSSDGQIRI